MKELHIDFETRSACDLKKTGLHVYAEHPTTDVWCAAYCFGDGPILTWVLGDPCPPAIIAAVKNKTPIWAHNAQFEICLWNSVLVKKHGWPAVSHEQFVCTMVMAYAMAVPASLEKAAAALGITNQKDMSGSRLMLQLASPRSTNPDGSIVWWDDIEKLERLIDYCEQDVRVERELGTRLFRLSPRETEIWNFDQVVNNRGIRIDVAAATSALEIIGTEKTRLDQRMKVASGGVVGTCTANSQILDFVRWNFDPKCKSVDKSSVAGLLAKKDLPGNVREVLMLRQEAAKSSTAKIQTMLQSCGPDHRVRGTFQYHGAATGRWSGRRVQTHNLPRPNISQDQIDTVLDRMRTNSVTAEELDICFGNPMAIISDCIRGLFIPAEGKTFKGADLANIEGRVLAWLAGEEWKLDAFRAYDNGTGPDIYKLGYARSFNVPVAEVSKDQRQIGKVMELALGFGGGVGAFQSMAKNYGVIMPDSQADEIKLSWRHAHTKTVSYWKDLEDAALSACRNPGQVYMAGHGHRAVAYRMAGSFLWCLLPTGRPLCYPYPKLEDKEMPWGQTKEVVTYLADGERHSVYGGLLSENCTQAVARDILAEGLLALEKAGYAIVLHVHDEPLSEVAPDFGSIKEIERLMTTLPAWAEGLPVAAEGWEGRRYQK